MDIKTINAPAGLWLTQASDTADTTERIYVTSVSGCGDIENLYRTATDEERALWLASRQTDTPQTPNE